MFSSCILCLQLLRLRRYTFVGRVPPIRSRHVEQNWSLSQIKRSWREIWTTIQSSFRRMDRWPLWQLLFLCNWLRMNLLCYGAFPMETYIAFLLQVISYVSVHHICSSRSLCELFSWCLHLYCTFNCQRRRVYVAAESIQTRLETSPSSSDRRVRPEPFSKASNTHLLQYSALVVVGFLGPEYLA